MSRQTTFNVSVQAPPTSLLAQAAAACTTPKSVAFMTTGGGLRPMITVEPDFPTNPLEGMMQCRDAAGNPVGSMAEYAGHCCWDPVNKRLMVIGGSHNNSGVETATGKVITYEDTTNTWLSKWREHFDAPFDPFHTSHNFNGQARDGVNGDNYYHSFNNNFWSRWNAAGVYQESITLPTNADLSSAIMPLTYWPSRHSIWSNGALYGLLEYDLATRTFFDRSAAISGGQNNTLLVHCPEFNCLVFGSTATAYRMDANLTLTAINRNDRFGVPFAFKTVADNSGCIMFEDPVSGKLVLIEGVTRDVYEFNGTGFTWTGYTLPSSTYLGSYTQLTSLFYAPISTYGVTLFVGDRTGQSSMWVYRHT